MATRSGEAVPRRRRLALGGRRARNLAVQDPEEGSASLQLAVVFPALLLMVLVVVQAGLYLFAKDLVHSTARVALEDARTQGSSTSTGVGAAQTYLAQQNKSGLLRDVTISADGSTATAVHMHVHASMTSLVPGLPITIDTDVQAPVERFVAP